MCSQKAHTGRCQPQWAGKLMLQKLTSAAKSVVKGTTNLNLVKSHKPLETTRRTKTVCDHVNTSSWKTWKIRSERKQSLSSHLCIFLHANAAKVTLKCPGSPTLPRTTFILSVTCKASRNALSWDATKTSAFCMVTRSDGTGFPIMLPFLYLPISSYPLSILPSVLSLLTAVYSHLVHHSTRSCILETTPLCSRRPAHREATAAPSKWFVGSSSGGIRDRKEHRLWRVLERISLDFPIVDLFGSTWHISAPSWQCSTAHQSSKRMSAGHVANTASATRAFLTAAWHRQSSTIVPSPLFKNANILHKSMWQCGWLWMYCLARLMCHASSSLQKLIETCMTQTFQTANKMLTTAQCADLGLVAGTSQP